MWHDARLLSRFLMYERQEKKGGINLTLFLLPTSVNLYKRLLLVDRALVQEGE